MADEIKIEPSQVRKKRKDLGGRPVVSVVERVEQKTFDLKKIFDLAAHGYLDKEIAGLLDITDRQLRTWKKDKRFSSALEQGRLKANDKVEKSLFKRAIGYKYRELTIEETPETVFDKEGNVIGVAGNQMTVTKKKKTVKHMAGDVGAIMNWLKNRSAERWKEIDKAAGGEHINVEKAVFLFPAFRDEGGVMKMNKEVPLHKLNGRKNGNGKK